MHALQEIGFPRLGPGIEGEDAPHRGPPPVIDILQIDIVEERRRVDIDIVLVQTG
jgi:hypothetical protein